MSGERKDMRLSLDQHRAEMARRKEVALARQRALSASLKQVDTPANCERNVSLQQNTSVLTPNIYEGSIQATVGMTETLSNDELNSTTAEIPIDIVCASDDLRPLSCNHSSAMLQHQEEGLPTELNCNINGNPIQIGYVLSSKPPYPSVLNDTGVDLNTDEVGSPVSRIVDSEDSTGDIVSLQESMNNIHEWNFCEMIENSSFTGVKMTREEVLRRRRERRRRDKSDTRDGVTRSLDEADVKMTTGEDNAHITFTDDADVPVTVNDTEYVHLIGRIDALDTFQRHEDHEFNAMRAHYSSLLSETSRLCENSLRDGVNDLGNCYTDIVRNIFYRLDSIRREIDNAELTTAKYKAHSYNIDTICEMISDIRKIDSASSQAVTSVCNIIQMSKCILLEEDRQLTDLYNTLIEKKGKLGELKEALYSMISRRREIMKEHRPKLINIRAMVSGFCREQASRRELRGASIALQLSGCKSNTQLHVLHLESLCDIDRLEAIVAIQNTVSHEINQSKFGRKVITGLVDQVLDDIQQET